MPVEHVNPDTLHRNPAFTQAVVIPAGARVAIIGGQNAVDADGNIVGKGDFGAQSAKAVDNLIAALDAVGADLGDVVKLTIFIVGDADLAPGFGAWMERWGTRENPPAISGIRVHGLAHPDFLVEIEAMAVLP